MSSYVKNAAISGWLNQIAQSETLPRLGWLIDARNRRVYIYRAGQNEPQLLDNPETLDGENVLPGFTFPVRRYIFDLE